MRDLRDGAGAAWSDAARWAVLYEPERLISAKRFDFPRTARSCLELALELAGAEAGLLALYDKGQDLLVVAAEGVDREAALEDPALAGLCREALERGAAARRESVAAGPSCPRAGGQHSVLALPLRLWLRSGEDVERERRIHPPTPLVKPLGLLLLLGAPGATPGGDRVAALEAYADHCGEVLTNARLYHVATHDPLTDLYRRTELEQHLAVELTIARHTDAPVALLMVDIDDLTRINHQHGRQRGDRVIARVARLIRAQLRRLDACIRYGGEEFAVVLPATGAEGAMVTAEKIRRAIAETAGFGGGVQVTVSIGVAVFPVHAEGQAEMLRKADQTLFMAKQEGGNRALAWHRRIPRHALRSDKLVGIITGNHAKDYRNVTMLLDTVVLVSSLLDRGQILGALLDLMVQLSGCERGALFLERDGALQVELAQDAAGAEAKLEGFCREALDRVRSQSLPVAVLGEVGEEGEVEAPEQGALKEASRRLGLRRVIALPLVVRGRQIGAMYFDAREPSLEFEESDLVFMQALAREQGNALESARLYQENLEQKRSLEELTGRLARQVQAQASELADMERNLTALKVRYRYDKLVGKSEAMQKVFKLLDRITDTEVPVLVTGETGTGKELVARSLHLNGPRRDGPFVSVNCSTVAESLMESELFGHVKGAFTGADRDKVGLFEQAHGGTIFLDEVQDMSPGLQRELLRVLQEGEIRRVGGKEIIKVDVRVVSATNRDLRAMVQDGEFRQDLFYRLNVVSLELPPLRDRKEDLPLLVQHLLDEVRTADGRSVQIDKGAMKALVRHDWPGNVRELRNAIEKAALLLDGDTITEDALRLDGQPGAGPGVSRLFEMNYNDAKASFAREYLKAVLARHGGNVTRAATEAGIVRSSFHKMMRKHGIVGRDFG